MTFGSETFNEEREGEDKVMMHSIKDKMNKREILAFPPLETQHSLSWLSLMVREEWGCLGNDVLKRKH